MKKFYITWRVCFMMEWSSEGMKAELAIYVNFTRLWKSCAYCKGKVHLTTLTSENYTNEEHTEWKLPVIEIDNEKWQMLGWVVAKKKKRVFINLVPHQESDPRPWGSTFPCYTTEATLQRTRWCSVSMVSYEVHRKTRNPEVWRLTAEEKLEFHRCPQLMTKRKTTLFIYSQTHAAVWFFHQDYLCRFCWQWLSQSRSS